MLYCSSERRWAINCRQGRQAFERYSENSTRNSRLSISDHRNRSLIHCTCPGELAVGIGLCRCGFPYLSRGFGFPFVKLSPESPGIHGTQHALIRRHVGKHVSYAVSNRTLLVDGVEKTCVPTAGKEQVPMTRHLEWLDWAGWGFEKLIDEQSPTMVGLWFLGSRCGAGDRTGWKPNGRE